MKVSLYRSNDSGFLHLEDGEDRERLYPDDMLEWSTTIHLFSTEEEAEKAKASLEKDSNHLSSIERCDEGGFGIIETDLEDDVASAEIEINDQREEESIA